MRMIQFGERCKHGLYCSCFICDKDKEIASLREENERLKGQINKVLYAGRP